MSALLSLLTSDPTALHKKDIHQLVAMCGNGKLTDGSECSTELREYLHVAESENLFAYADSCLTESFDKSGSVLQDVVNELGRRLEYTVEDGLYHGKSNAIGNDGLWADGNGHEIVVEVKTTDAYSINLDTIAKYRDHLIASKKISSSSSVLLVVGRQDTGGWEAQVRGSSHARVVRIISVDALKKLVSLKENSKSASVEKIHELLVPFEYIRLDRIIEIAFEVAEDASTALEEESPKIEVEPEEPGEKQHQHTSSEILGAIRSAIVEKLSTTHTPLVKKSRALFWSADKTVRAVITISKEYPNGGFWYAYHLDWDTFLSQGTTGLFVLGCVGRSAAFAIPYAWIHSRLDKLYITEGEGRKYHHIVLSPTPNGQMALHLKSGVDESLEAFKVSV